MIPITIRIQFFPYNQRRYFFGYGRRLVESALCKKMGVEGAVRTEHFATSVYTVNEYDHGLYLRVRDK